MRITRKNMDDFALTRVDVWGNLSCGNRRLAQLLGGTKARREGLVEWVATAVPLRSVDCR